jgi:hypothetical protein
LQKKTVLFPIGYKVFLPLQDEKQALRRAVWLLELHTKQHNQHTIPAIEVLTHWANIREREEPKAFILGLILGVEPFGLWGEPNTKHHPVDIIVRDTVVKKIKKTQLAKMSVALTSEIIQKGLIEVNGNANLLEPELSDWFFGDKTVVFYSADTETLSSIESAIHDAHAPNALRSDTDGTTFLAVGPTIYINDLSESDKLEEIT